MQIKLFNKLKDRLKKPIPMELTRDEIQLNLKGLNLHVKRETTSNVPSELSVIVPRVEYDDNKVIINSITIVISPRHPLAENAQKRYVNGKLLGKHP
ncbi:MAG: hypothetical protein ACOYED_04320 [Peptococcia bacterium]|jgi:hypothetical protein